MRSICLGVAILIGSVFGASAQDKTPQAGAQDGVYFEDPCHGTDVLIGYNTTTGKALNTIAAVCQPQNNGVLTGTSYALKTHGKPPDPQGGVLGPGFGVAPDGERCQSPTGQAIYGMSVWLNKYNEPDVIGATCVWLQPNGAAQTQIGYTSGIATSVTQSAIGCGSGVAVGITGRSTDLMISLGLICSNFPWHVAATPPPTNILKVIAAADVYDRPNPGNVPPIYPDGLDPAAPKNIVLVYLLEVGKDDNVNWYRVNWNGSPPQPLWVYSGVAANDQITFDAASLATAKATVNGGH
jgi:hypothetical protein